MVRIAYNATYTTDDVTEAAIDGVVKFVIAIAGLAALIGLVFIATWVMKKTKK